MTIDTSKTTVAVLAPAVQKSVTSIWIYYVHPVMPGLGDSSTGFLVGLCAAIVVAHLSTLGSRA